MRGSAVRFRESAPFPAIQYQGMLSAPPSRVSPLRTVFRLIVGVLAICGAWYLTQDTYRRIEVQAEPRPVTPRRELMADEQAVIGLFEAAKGSVVRVICVRK